jgi:enoyl-CoA hydratase/carnithine racemase
MPDGAESPLLLRTDSAEGVTRLALNRPGARNALSVPMLTALEEALAAIATDEAVRVVVLAAEGPVFCAGHDLRELTARRADPDAGRAFFEDAMARCARVMQAIVALPQPVIAEVQGVATAAGCQLVATCDLAVASEAARFCTPGVDIGLFCSTPAVALSRAVAAKPAMEMLLTGDMIGAAEAQRIGLVNRVVAPEALRGAVEELAHRIAARSALTVRLG